MQESKYLWQKEASLENDLKALSEATNLAPIICQILVQRGFATPEDIQAFLDPTADAIHDPYLLHDMEKAVERLKKAIVDQEQIVIYGDYDADGITSTSLMYETLEQLGANVSYYLPDRFVDGYGPNKAVYEYLINDGAQLILTVDNGISGHEALTYAKEQGIDVIVTDHHELPATLPPAYAIIHPRHPAGQYPFGQLAGVGVAFKLASALLETPPTDMLDLVAIGTVADLVPLTGENRALVKFGINSLKTSFRPGLLSLFGVAGIEQEQIDATAIGFRIAPRLNSLGRLETATPGVDLLTSLDEELTNEIAQEVQSLNAKRVQLVADITEAATAQLSDLPADRLVNVVYAKDWHQGVLGIVASRLVELTNKPTIVLTLDEKTGHYKGSGRSVPQFNLFKALDPKRELLESFGGHHMACGLTVAESQMPALIDALNAAAQEQGLTPTTKPALNYVGEISLAEIDLNLLNQLDLLAPFGTDNASPLFKLSGFTVLERKVIGKKQNCLSLTLGDEAGNQLKAISFNLAPEVLWQVMQADLSEMALVGSLNKNEWRNEVTPQFLIKDLSVKPARFIDQRSNNLYPDMFKTPGEYICFREKIATQLTAGQFCAREIKVASEIEDSTPIKVEQLVIVDLPPNLSQLKELLSKYDYQSLRVIFYSKTNWLSFVMPERADFIRLYKFVMNVPKIDFKKDLPMLVDHFKLKKDTLIFMFKVFFEVGFVKIKDGFIIGNDNATYHKLEETDIYQQYLTQIETARQLLAGPAPFLKKYLDK